MYAAMMRFQEHYESPKFRGKSFTHKEFNEWYKKKYGKNYSGWVGFNFPGYVYRTASDVMRLTKREKAVAKVFDKCGRKKFYVIATIEDDALDHEIAHAMYYLDSRYRTQARAEAKKITASPLYKDFKEMGYCDEVLEDELNAYLATGNPKEDSWPFRHGADGRQLKILFERYKDKNVWKLKAYQSWIKEEAADSSLNTRRSR